MADDQKKKIREHLNSLTPKQKQYIILFVFGSIFLAIVFGGVTLWDQQEPVIPKAASNTTPESKNIVAAGSQVDPREAWMEQSSRQLKQMEDVINALKQQMSELEKKQQEQKPLAENVLPPFPMAQPDVQPPQPPAPPPPPAPLNKDEARMMLQQGKMMPNMGIQGAYEPPPLPQEPGIATFEIVAAHAAEKGDAQKKNGAYIPSGSFMRAVLLGGLDAPTGGQAQNNPWPVLMRVHDNAFLPNRYRARVRECFLLGSGYGDISSERAYLRLESISCVLDTGEVVDTEAKGYIVGEDGKAGMRGRLVTKQGQVLANALMTGIISGIGQGIQNSSMNYSTSALGTVGTPQTGKEFVGGLGAGIGRALDRLSQYYIDLAEKMFPVIEIDAGRVVDVVLTKGVTIKVPEK